MNPYIGRQIKVTLPDQVIARVDRMRGQTPRSEVLRNVIINWFGDDDQDARDTPIDLTDM